jgi:hypothetical protein
VQILIDGVEPIFEPSQVSQDAAIAVRIEQLRVADEQ